MLVSPMPQKSPSLPKWRLSPCTACILVVNWGHLTFSFRYIFSIQDDDITVLSFFYVYFPGVCLACCNGTPILQCNVTQNDNNTIYTLSPHVSDASCDYFWNAEIVSWKVSFVLLLCSHCRQWCYFSRETCLYSLKACARTSWRFCRHGQVPKGFVWLTYFLFSLCMCSSGRGACE